MSECWALKGYISIMKAKDIGLLIVCIAVPLIVGSVSGLFTAKEINGWLLTLNKPSFNPPNYLFGPVWTALYTLMGISLFLIYKSPLGPERTRALWIFALQLFLNFWWSIIFFAFHSPFWAMVEIICLWMCIAWMILSFLKVKPVAAYLQIAYLLWVSFASLLSISIWRLN